MSEQAQSVLQAALALTEAERGELIRRLEDSMPLPDGEDFDETAFAAELERRRNECFDGTDPGVPWSEIETMIRDELDAGPRR
ncbi:MAG: addiction module protein [Gemmataceae bacterium]